MAALVRRIDTVVPWRQNKTLEGLSEGELEALKRHGKTAPVVSFINKVLIVPSKPGQNAPAEGLHTRSEYPEPNTLESCILFPKSNESGESNAYIAYPKRKLCRLPGTKIPVLVTWEENKQDGGVISSLDLSRHLTQYVRIWPGGDDTTHWSPRPELTKKWGRELQPDEECVCWLNYILNAPNQLVAYAYEGLLPLPSSGTTYHAPHGVDIDTHGAKYSVSCYEGTGGLLHMVLVPE